MKNHEALAACGIGALSRLLLGAGHRFDENAWTIAIDALADAMNKTAPDVQKDWSRKTRRATSCRPPPTALRSR